MESPSSGAAMTDLPARNGFPQTNGDDSHLNKIVPNGKPKPTSLTVEKPRDLRDEKDILATPSASRPASPYTLNPPIDFDGLSWPSKLQSQHCKPSLKT